MDISITYNIVFFSLLQRFFFLLTVSCAGFENSVHGFGNHKICCLRSNLIPWTLLLSVGHVKRTTTSLALDGMEGIVGLPWFLVHLPPSSKDPSRCFWHLWLNGLFSLPFLSLITLLSECIIEEGPWNGMRKMWTWNPLPDPRFYWKSQVLSERVWWQSRVDHF